MNYGKKAKTEVPRHSNYVKYPLADILIIVMCGVLSGLDTLGNLVICEENRAEFLSKILGIKNIPSKAAFARVLSIVGGRQVEARQFIGAE